jgi:hypothetical protein
VPEHGRDFGLNAWLLQGKGLISGFAGRERARGEKPSTAALIMIAKFDGRYPCLRS